MVEARSRNGARTGLIEMSADDCWQRLRETRVGRIAVMDGSVPDIFPVNYRVHRDEIVIRTEAGTKLAAATLMMAVAFEIDDIDAEARSGWSVVVKGHGREPTTLEESLALDDLGLDPWVDAPKSRWLVVTPTEVTGRQIP
jgi:nitroimidazol reductase NimA-like FMN-containing flavoprotein (pyridoxamine 5'-phosphate oxidase superfamily)